MRTNNDRTIADFAPAFRLLNGRLALAGAPVFHLVVCGGTALVAMGFVSRATRDVDIVALLDPSGGLVDPSPLPEPLLAAAADQPGSYHVADLHVLAPTDDELVAGARWARSHDPSEGYRSALAHLFEGIDRGHLVALL